MNQIDKDFQEKLQNKEIGYVEIQHGRGITAENIFSIVQGNGNINLLINAYDLNDESRVLIQDLKGKELKRLMHFDKGFVQVAVDDENIYVFTSKTNVPMFYRFNKKTLELEYKKNIEETGIESVCSNGKELCTFDIDKTEIQIRDKNGNVLNRKNTSIPNCFKHHIIVYSANEKFQYSRRGELIGDEEYINRLGEKYGQSVIRYNPSIIDIAYDKETDTTFKVTNRIIYVNSPSVALEGILYYSDTHIIKAFFDQQINSLIIYKFGPNDKKTIEILPWSLIIYKMKASKKYLIPNKELPFPTVEEYTTLSQDDYIEIEQAPLVRHYTKLQ